MPFFLPCITPVQNFLPCLQIWACPNSDSCTYSGRVAAIANFQAEIFNGSIPLAYANGSLYPQSTLTAYWVSKRIFVVHIYVS